MLHGLIHVCLGCASYLVNSGWYRVAALFVIVQETSLMGLKVIQDSIVCKICPCSVMYYTSLNSSSQCVRCVVHCGLSACSIFMASTPVLVVNYSVHTAADGDMC